MKIIWFGILSASLDEERSLFYREVSEYSL